MGLRGRKKNPNAKAIRAGAARIRRRADKIVKQVLHDSIDELMYEATLEAAINDIFSSMADEFMSDVVLETMHSIGSAITPRKINRSVPKPQNPKTPKPQSNELKLIMYK